MDFFALAYSMERQADRYGVASSFLAQVADVTEDFEAAGCPWADLHSDHSGS